MRLEGAAALRRLHDPRLHDGAAGVVEKGYYKASKARGGTHLRLPWVTKVK